MRERLFWGQRGGFRAEETFEERGKGNEESGENKNYDGDDDGPVEFDDTRPTAQKQCGRVQQSPGWEDRTSKHPTVGRGHSKE